MKSLPSPPIPASAPAIPRRLSASTSILLVLSKQEEAIFFPASTAFFPPHVRFDPKENRDAWEETLRKERPEVIVSCWHTPALPEEWLNSADCPLRYLCHVTGTVRRIIPRSFLEKGGWVTNWGSLAASCVAEHALLLALSSLRNQPGWSACFVPGKRGQPFHCLQTRSLFGRRVGIHGFGAVARQLVSLLRPFQTSITAYSAGVPEALMHSEAVRPSVSLEDLFQNSDVLFECEAWTPSTERCVTRSLLAMLPDQAVFVNVGRGQVVDEQALWEESLSGRLRVALDVVSSSPPDMEVRFLQLKNAIISPHIAGPTLDHCANCGENALENLTRYLNGQLPECLLTPEIYDRST